MLCSLTNDNKCPYHVDDGSEDVGAAPSSDPIDLMDT